MTSRTHDIFAFASLVTVATYYPPASLNLTTSISCLIGNIVGSLLPDIDQATNRLWDLFPVGNFIGKIFRKLFIAHRTISHSILGIFLVNKLLLLLLPKLFNPSFIFINLIHDSIMIGFISHLLLDCLTEEGIPLLFPIKWKIGFPPISRLRIKTGKWFEKFVVFPGIVVFIILFVGSHQKEILALLKLLSINTKQ